MGRALSFELLLFDGRAGGHRRAGGQRNTMFVFVLNLVVRREAGNYFENYVVIFYFVSVR